MKAQDDSPIIYLVDDDEAVRDSLGMLTPEVGESTARMPSERGPDQRSHSCDGRRGAQGDPPRSAAPLGKPHGKCRAAALAA